MKKKQPDYILITSSNFPRGSAAANYLNLFCRGISSLGSSIQVYILKGYFLKGQKINDLKKNQTDYGVNYSYLGFVNRSSNKIFKILGDIYGFFSLIFLLASLFKWRKEITIFAYNNEIQHSILLNSYCRLTRTKLVTFVPEYYDKSEFEGSFLTRLRWYGFLINFHYLNRISDKLIVFSTYIKERYLEKEFPEEKILVQPNLTDFEFWKKSAAEPEFTLGYSGTPYKKDGIEDLLMAVSLLRKKNIIANTVIIGDVVNEKSIIPGLKLFCDSLGISDTVIFVGHVTINEVAEWLNKCLILAITRPDIVQTQAGFPTKIGEYFACQKTVLSTRIGDVACYFEGGKEIIFAEPGNPQSIADRIEWILNNNEESRKIAMDGYKRAKELLNYMTKIPEMIDFVKKG